MALLDELIARIPDDHLRRDFADAIADLRKTQRLGIVFEQHAPETVGLKGLPVQPGSLVHIRTDSEPESLDVVESCDNEVATVRSLRDHSARTVAVRDALIVKRFGDPIYPALIPSGAIANGAKDRGCHLIIDGENFHVLQLFVYLYEHEVDCIYIDPPYNSGASDWKYNNRYVDANDEWRHSKWLSFMQKRLALAKRLLKEDGILVCSIDENEHAHLTMLLEQEFPEYDLTSVAIVHNPRGIQGDNFSYTNEFAVFAVPRKRKLIADRIIPPDERDTRDLRDNGGGSLRTDARNCFYPILIKDDNVVGFGAVPPDDFHPAQSSVAQEAGITEVWPIDRNGIERKWRYARQSVESIASLLSVAYSSRNGSTRTPQIKLTKETGKYRTVWAGSRYDANAYGTKLVTALTGTTFPFPKSVFTVKDILIACTQNRPNAVILDFFAGSGTTFHATCLLNEDDGGSRRCILVTNNEVGVKQAQQLRELGYFPGDRHYEKAGIYESVIVPRCMAVVTGKTPDGVKLRGELEGRPLGKAFAENVQFLRMQYLNPDEIDLGQQFNAVLPSLWVSSGAVGSSKGAVGAAFHVPPDSNYAVLMDERHFREFREIVHSRNDLKKIWIVTDSEEAFAEMRSSLPQHLKLSMLYRDYLRNFRINTRLTF